MTSFCDLEVLGREESFLVLSSGISTSDGRIHTTPIPGPISDPTVTHRSLRGLVAPAVEFRSAPGHPQRSGRLGRPNQIPEPRDGTEPHLARTRSNTFGDEVRPSGPLR